MTVKVTQSCPTVTLGTVTCQASLSMECNTGSHITPRVKHRTLFNINHSKFVFFFFICVPKQRKVKAKNKWDLIKFKSFAQQIKPWTK